MSTAAGPHLVPPPAPRPRRSVLDWLEWAGNKLPDAPLLFLLLALAVVIASAVATAAGVSAQPVQPRIATVEARDASGNLVPGPDGRPARVKVTGPDGRPEITLVPVGKPVEPRSLLTVDGIYWMLSSMLRNFAGLPSLPLIFVGMIGIGVAEKFGFFSALMRAVALRTPARLLTPAVILVGANSSAASDAGYIVLPPLAAALFQAVGRSPIAGLAAAFSGVAGGFGAGFFPSGGDGAITGFAQDAARIVDPAYSVTILHNFYFKCASVVVVTLAGWWITDRVVEPRLRRAAAVPAALAPPPSAQPGSELATMAISARERSALRRALLGLGAVLASFAVLILVPGMPLHGPGLPTLPSGRVLAQKPVVVAPPGAALDGPAGAVLSRDPLFVAEVPGGARLVESPAARWSHAVVPIIFFAFLVPGVIYGRRMGLLRSQSDLVEALFHGVRQIAPVLVTIFFMAQFVNYFSYTNLDRIVAYGGGALLAGAHLPVSLLLVLFVGVVILGDFALSGMLSKFGVLAPVFIPMFMLIGISPEATTAAYRIGDSVVNVITPLNSYALIILAVFQKYRKDAGLGSLISLMVPYSLGLGLAWTALLVAWILLGLDLGPAAPLQYLPPGDGFSP